MKVFELSNVSINQREVSLLFSSSFLTGREKTVYYCYDPNKYPTITWEELEGQDYEILEQGKDYTIVLYKGKYYVVYE